MLKQLLSAALLLVAPLAHAATVQLDSRTAMLGDSVTIGVHATGFPETGGATLGLEFNPSVIQLNTITLSTGSPFNAITHTAIDNIAGKVNFITILAPLTGALPKSDFGAFTMQFTAVGLGTSPVTLIDDGNIKAWAGSAFSPIQGITYQQGLVVVPVPAALWLFGSGLLGLLGVARRHRSAKAAA